MLEIIIFIIIFLTFSPLVKFIHLIVLFLFLVVYFICKKNEINIVSGVKLVYFLLFLFCHYYFKEIIMTKSGVTFTRLILSTEIIFKFIISYFLSQLITKKRYIFLDKLEKIIFLLSIISLCFFSIQLINPKYIFEIPGIRIDGIYSIFLQTFIFSKETILIKRNSGIAWEPGAYQLLVNLGFFLYLKKIKNLYKIKNIIYIITILTTLSTVGIIILLIQILYFMIKLLNIKKMFVRFMLLVIVFNGVLINDIRSEQGIIRKHVIEKLNLKNKNASTLIRKRHFEMDLKSFQKNILLGRGLLRYQNDRNNEISSNSYTRILAVYGILFFLAYSINLIIGIKYFIGENWILLASIIFLTFTNEILWASPLVLIFLFMEKRNENKIM